MTCGCEPDPYEVGAQEDYVAEQALAFYREELRAEINSLIAHAIKEQEPYKRDSAKWIEEQGRKVVLYELLEWVGPK